MTNQSVLHNIRILDLFGFWLTFGAEVSTPIPHHYPLNRGAAEWAGLAATVGNLEVVMGEACLSTWTVVGVSAGTHVLDTTSQHLLNGVVKSLHLVGGEASS